MWRRIERMRTARQAALAGVVVLFAATPACAQSDWVPFRDRDDRAASARRTPPPSVSIPDRPQLAPMRGEGAYDPPGRADFPPVGREAYERGPDPRFQAPPRYDPPRPGDPYRPESGRIGIGPPPAGPAQGPLLGPSGAVERYDLAPLPAADGSGLPDDFWRDLDLKSIEQGLSAASVPPKSPALAELLQRALKSSATEPRGAQAPNHWQALRLEAFYRSGYVAAMEPLLQTSPGDPLLTMYRVRKDLALGRTADVCAATTSLVQRRSELPERMRGEMHLLSGYCAAVDGDRAGAELAAALAREAGVDAPLALGALEAIGGDGKTGMPAPKRIHVLDFRLLETMGPVEPAQILERAEPALLTALAVSAREPRLRVAAAELASVAGAVDARILADAWRSATADNDPVFRRARLFQAAETGGAPAERLAAARTLLDETRRTPIYLASAASLVTLLDAVPPGPDAQAYGDTMIEIALAAGRPAIARRWAEASPAHRHWLALADVADGSVEPRRRVANLEGLDEIVRRNRFSAPALHRLATVLDATDVNVPIPLWEAASRTPQPATGHLPETGVLPQLADAAKKKETGRTVLLAMQVLGGPATGAHIISLGDTIRALRRVGLDREARQIGVEALLADWPPGGGA